MVGALIAVLSLGGVAYVFRDDLARWTGTFPAKAPSAGPAEEAMKPPAAKLPPLAPQTAARSVAGAAGGEPGSAVSACNEFQRPNRDREDRASIVGAPGPAPRPVTAEALADALPPRVTQASVGLPTATVGSPYRAELPAFADPGGKGLRLTASGLPGGLSFSDLGGGKGAIEGVPHEAASASIRIVAANHNDRRAQMSATLVVADKPASSPGPVAKLEPRLSAPAAVPAPAPAQPAPSHQPAAASQVPAPAPQATIQSSAPAAADQAAAPAAPPSAATPQTVAPRRNAPTGGASRRDRRALGGRAGADRKSRAARPSAHCAGVAGGKSQGVHRQL